MNIAHDHSPDTFGTGRGRECPVKKVVVMVCWKHVLWVDYGPVILLIVAGILLQMFAMLL